MASHAGRRSDSDRGVSGGPLSLSLKKLARAGALVPGRSGDWQWTRDGKTVSRISLKAERGRIALLYRFVNDNGEPEHVRETVRIVRHASALDDLELAFVCPGKTDGVVCRRRVATLYGAGRYFLCRHCAQLTHAPADDGDFGFFSSKPIRTAAAAASFGVAVMSAQAFAAGFAIRENSAASVGTATAGAGSLADSASTVFNNPAGMMRLMGNEVEIGTVAILPSIEFEGSASVMGTPIPGNNGGQAGKNAFVPNLFWVFDISNRLKGGLAVTVPFGLGTEYDEQWAGRYLGIKTDALSADINPSIAFRVNDRLSIGIGVSAQYFKLDATSAIAQFLPLGAGTPDAIWRFNADDWSFGFNAGALLEVTDATRVGLTYRSQIDHRIEGDLEFTGISPLLGMVDSPAASDVHLPATIGLGVTHDVNPAFTLTGDVQFTQWSVFKNILLESLNPPVLFEQRYQDSWMVAVGGIYRPNDVWTFRAGFSWDQTPITDLYRAVTLPDIDRYLVGVGVGYRLNDRLLLDVGYEHSFASKTATMTGSANAVDVITGAVTLAGDYDVAVDIVGVSLRFKY